MKITTGLCFQMPRSYVKVGFLKRTYSTVFEKETNKDKKNQTTLCYPFAGKSEIPFLLNTWCVVPRAFSLASV